ncbi:uncharacterized protein LOC142404474 [Mycteria americana]|uniref:uncharacterized protein LOC142404474 n=1 Tax=Mycteria americana TaxID=33587 RepID=UPI003F585B20
MKKTSSERALKCPICGDSTVMAPQNTPPCQPSVPNPQPPWSLPGKTGQNRLNSQRKGQEKLGNVTPVSPHHARPTPGPAPGPAPGHRPPAPHRRHPLGTPCRCRPHQRPPLRPAHRPLPPRLLRPRDPAGTFWLSSALPVLRAQNVAAGWTGRRRCSGPSHILPQQGHLPQDFPNIGWISPVLGGFYLAAPWGREVAVTVGMPQPVPYGAE